MGLFISLLIYLIPARTLTIEIPSPQLTPQLKEICSCESSYSGRWDDEPRHYNPDGSIRFNNKTGDYGACQINEVIWGKVAKKLHLDIKDEKDHIKFANWLYEKYGARPWSASYKCHKQND